MSNIHFLLQNEQHSIPQDRMFSLFEKYTGLYYDFDGRQSDVPVWKTREEFLELTAEMGFFTPLLLKYVVIDNQPGEMEQVLSPYTVAGLLTNRTEYTGSNVELIQQEIDIIESVKSYLN